MFCPHKNSYLQLKNSYVNPRILNRSVDLARSQPCIDPHDGEPPFQRLTSEQPCTPIENIDVTRRPQAFGRWALPKLRRELHSDDLMVVLQAVASICDLVHDPEKGYEAIRLNIPDRLEDLLINPFTPIREHAALALTIIAGLGDGKEAIVKNNRLLDNLALGVNDEEPGVRIKIAACLEMIARSWMAADCLVDYGFIAIILDSVNEEVEETTVIHLETLKSLMYNDGKNIALDLEAFKIFMSLLDRDSPEIVSKSFDCLMILTTTPLGKKLAIEKNLLTILNKFLYNDNIEVCTSAVSMLMFCTKKTRAKHLASNISNLAKRLIQLAKNPENIALQMFCVKALTNICEHPLIRKEVLENYMDEVVNMQVRFDPVYKETLLKVLNWMPYTAE